VSEYLFLAAAEKNCFFFKKLVFVLPLLRNAQKHDKKNEQNNAEREGEKTEGKKTH
jgi:hypothetical protein